MRRKKGDILFLQKNLQSSAILISGSFLKNFTLMPLALCDGTTAQLQICSSERNVPLLPVDWKKDK
jgi:hypothetical protein